MPGAGPRIAVAIVSYNTRDVLRECLASVIPENPAEVVVVDNGSTDGTPGMIRSAFPEVRVSGNGGNPGYGAALNRALFLSRAEFVLALNSDTALAPGALESLVRYMDAHPRAAVLGPRLANPDGSLQRSCRRYPGSLAWVIDNRLTGRFFKPAPWLARRLFSCWQHDSSRVVPWVTGAAMCLRADAVRAAGGFDESFFMYCEETDLCFRLQERGWEIHFAPVTTVVHSGGVSTRNFRRDMAEEFAVSNLRFYRKRYSRPRVIALTAVMHAFFAARLVRDWVRLRFSAMPESQAAGVREDLAAWRSLLFGDALAKPRNAAARVSANAGNPGS